MHSLLQALELTLSGIFVLAIRAKCAPLLWFASLAAGQCGPPNYTCSSNSTAIVQTPAPPITSTSPTATTCSGQCTNAIGYDTSLNTAGRNPILRASDGTVLDGFSPSGSPSGGDNDMVWSCAGSSASPACASATTYFLEATYGANPFVAAIQIDPTTNIPKVVGPFPPHTGLAYHPLGAGGAIEFSRLIPDTGYLEAAPSGDPLVSKVVYTWDGVQGHYPTFVQTTQVDAGAVCPIPNGPAYGESWSGPISSPDDDLFVWSSSNVHGISTGAAAATVADASTSVTVVTTSIGTVAVHTGAAGTGYVVGDAVTVQGGTAGKLAVIRVSSVGGGGVVTGVTVYAVGAGYTNGTKTTSGGSGSGLQVDITVGLLTDGSYANALIKLGNPFVNYTIASNTATTITLTGAYSGAGCASGCQMQVPSGQGTGTYMIAYRASNNSCSVWNTYTGAVTGTGSFPTGTIDTGCHNMYIHDAYATADGQYAHVSGASTGVSCGQGIHFWNVATLHAVSCTAEQTIDSSGLCGGHVGTGYHNEVYVRSSGFFNVDPATTPASPTPVAPFATFHQTCDQHFAWRNSINDTQYTIGTTADNNFSTSATTSTYAFPYVNEIYGLGLDGTLRRFAHTFTLGPGTICGATDVGPFDDYFTAMYSIGGVSQDGKLFSFSSSMLGQLGTDASSNTRADLFVIGLDAGSPTNAHVSISGGVKISGGVSLR